MYINFLRLLEDFRCVKDTYFLIYTGSAENTLTLWRQQIFSKHFYAFNDVHGP